ncbi:MAG: winged helix-turn-helix domain-containing protein [Acidobacteria bacterium]|nr:winged helix-turn-helix domain-containing protein [Acidobacteriota bacterium]
MSAGELKRRGRRVRLGPQPLNVLTTLVTANGEIVSRDTLRQRIWGETTFVDFEHGINFCIREIRSKLGDSAGRPRFIETIPRRGYRFIAEVRHGATSRNLSTKEVQVHELYLRARASFHQAGKQSLEESRDLFEQVLRLDAGYAMAHSSLGATYALRNINRRDPEDLKLADLHLRRALALDPELAEPYPWLCYVNVRLGRLAEAMETGRQGVALLPDLVQAQYFLGMTYFCSVESGADHYGAAALHLREAVRIAPGWQPSWLGLSYIALLNGDYSAAKESAGHLLPQAGSNIDLPFLGGEHAIASALMREGDWPGARTILLQFLERMTHSDHMYRDAMSAAAACILGDLFLREGAHAEALASYRKAWHILQERRRIVGHPRLCVRAQAGMAHAYARHGDRDRGRHLLAQAIETAEASTSIAHTVPVASLAEQFHAIATAQIAFGDTKEALRSLRRAVQSGWRDRSWLQRDPLLRNVREMPDFVAVLRMLPPPDRR